MFQAARKHMRSVAMLAVAAALVVGGVAAAQGGSDGGSPAKRMLDARVVGPPPFGPEMGNLTYAELHVQKDGKAQTIRLDQGKITAVDDGSITLAENDGNEVTIPVDSETPVMSRPNVTFSSADGAKAIARAEDETTLGDLEVGQQVTASTVAGGTAESIVVLPEQGEMAATLTDAAVGGPMPPPPGTQDRQSGSGN